MYQSVCRCIMAVLMPLLITATSEAAPDSTCAPTSRDQLGPFYRPNAPVRNSIGAGYVLNGTVRSALDCRPLPNVRVEVWQTGPGGAYSDDYRATLFSGEDGGYRLETSFPPTYGSRPSHIHILVDAGGFDRLITQHYPAQGAKEATFDLVLVPQFPDGVKTRQPEGRL